MKLIDAELTAKNIARHRFFTLEVGNDEMNKKMECYNPSAFSAGFDYGMKLAQEVVSNQPTAYDVDKILEQLAMNSHRVETHEYGSERVVRLIDATYIVKGIYEEISRGEFDKAIEIVKSGGAV